ncbi:hypothetical protein ACG93R_16960 [Acinetobacter guillouiae]|uniref:hypothetical protein n=1 Tax=Acinetobacter guillouiae TaxID=106649 RepID=UPI003AF58CEC
MNITCPNCGSENISRGSTRVASNNNFSSMAGAGIGASLSKHLPTPLSPLLGGLAGAMVGGLIDSFVQPQRPQQTVNYFYCHHCQNKFQ